MKILETCGEILSTWLKQIFLQNLIWLMNILTQIASEVWGKLWKKLWRNKISEF